MKNKLTKIYNIFKQIENMNGSVGWDQIDVFYYFYEEHKNYLACWQLLYGLFSENKTLKPTIFGITLTELRKFSDAKSVIYTFENSEEPILVATFERNGKHQVSGTVKIEDTLITDEKEVTFVDGMNLDSEVDNSINKQISLSFSFFDYIEKFYALSDNELKSIINKLKNIDGFTMYIDIDNNVQWSSEENLSDEIADKLVELLHSTSNQSKIIKFNLIEKSPNAYSGIFNPDTMITDFVDISDDDALLLVANYVVVCYHDNNDNIIEINDQEDLQEYRSNYNDNRLFVWKSELNEKGLTENFKNELSFKVFETFQINGETPDTLNDLDEVSQFLDYLYDDCGLLGGFHPDDTFDNYIDDLTKKPIFTKEQQELYSKYIDDMFEMDSDGESLFKSAGYEDVYDYCMNYRNDSYVKKEFDFVAYVEDDKLSVGIKSDIPFPGSEDLGDNSFTKYMYFSPREEGFFPEYNDLRITWGDDTNSWNVETNSGFSMLDIRIHQAWEEEDENTNIESIINVNGIVYKAKLIRNEDNKNKYYLEFYQLEGDAQSELVGDCELIYDERTSSIDEINWTLPEYELIIDPEDELFESEDLHEMISNIELK